MRDSCKFGWLYARLGGPVGGRLRVAVAGWRPMVGTVLACGVLVAAGLTCGSTGRRASAAETYVSPLESRCLGPATQLTDGMTKAGEGYFNPDGRRIAYQAVPPGFPFYQIYVQDFAADDPGPRPPRRISTGRGRTTCAWFSPDGTRLLFASSHLDPNLDATETAARAEAAEDARTGRRRRYQWDFDPHMDLFVADLASGGLTRLTDTPGYDAECSFSPDGSRILFVSDRDGDPDIYLAAADGSDVTQLTNAPGYDGGPFFSPDGRWIAYRTDRLEKDRLQIHVMRADGSGDTAVTAGEGVHWAPFWHPTRPWLIWTGADHSDPTQRPNYDLWIVRYETESGGFRTTAPLRLTDHASADVLPAFSPDGAILMWTSGRGPDGGGRAPASQLWVSRLDLDAIEAHLAALPLGDAAGAGDGD
jgi:TolB protein